MAAVASGRGRCIADAGLVRDKNQTRAADLVEISGTDLYQVGVLHALHKGIAGRSLRTIDAYSGISSGSIAAQAGLARGDTLLRINDEPVQGWQEARWRLLQLAIAHAQVELEVQDGQKSTLHPLVDRGGGQHQPRGFVCGVERPPSGRRESARAPRY